MTWIRATWAQARHEPLMVVAAVLLFASTVSSAFSGWMAYDALRRVEAEADARARQSCDRTLATRDENEQLLIDIVTDLGGDPAINEAIHRHYAVLPTPADCDPDPQGGTP